MVPLAEWKAAAISEFYELDRAGDVMDTSLTFADADAGMTSAARAARLIRPLRTLPPSTGTDI
jgi:hypothetical protein